LQEKPFRFPEGRIVKESAMAVDMGGGISTGLIAVAAIFELLWRNEAPFSSPNVAVDVLGAKALIFHARRDHLERHLDLPWFKADEYQIQKLAMTLSHVN
jgi:hypothetical protein